MALPGLVAAKNLADVADRERAWDNLGVNVSANITTPESLAYIAAVEQADGAFLEEEVKQAIHAFVVACKFDGTWAAIKASCILAGARTRLGALTPLVGTAPTSFNFTDGDYNRRTGLVGDGSTKYLDSGRNNNADPQDSAHQGVFVSDAPTLDIGRSYIGAGGTANGTSSIFLQTASPGSIRFRSRTNTGLAYSGPTFATTGLIAHSRSVAAEVVARAGGANATLAGTSQVPHNGSVLVFGRNSNSNTPGEYLNARLAFYSIGESLDLALLDARVTTLINAFAAAIP
jgi:hypothetical protein